MAWDDRPEDLTPPPCEAAPIPPKSEPVYESRCYCGKPNSVCIEEDGADCHHPFAAAHMWGD